VVIQIPSALRQLAGNRDKVEVEAETVRQALSALLDLYPPISRYIFDENQRLRSYVNIFLNDRDVRDLDGLDTKLKEDDRIYILPAIAGGVMQLAYT